jgi:hypothetical protein
VSVGSCPVGVSVEVSNGIAEALAGKVRGEVGEGDAVSVAVDAIGVVDSISVEVSGTLVGSNCAVSVAVGSIRVGDAGWGVTTVRVGSCSGVFGPSASAVGIRYAITRTAKLSIHNRIRKVFDTRDGAIPLPFLKYGNLSTWVTRVRP